VLEDFFNGFSKQRASVVDKRYLGTVKLKIEANYSIPSIFRQLYPKLSEKEYLKLKNHEGFLAESIQLCEQCYNEKIKECRLYETIEGSQSAIKFAGLSKVWKIKSN
jgi:hypothetical protein